MNFTPHFTRPTRRHCFRLASVAVAAALSLPLALAGCGDSDDTTAGGGAAGADTKRLAFVTNNASDFWSIARAGTKKAEEELGGEVAVEFRIPGDGTAATQKREVNDLLARGIDGIAISPVDPANQTSLLNTIAAQSLLVTHDSDAPESDRAFYVGTDNVAAGRQAGELLKQALPEGGTVMLFVGTLDAQNAAERKRGIEEVLEGTGITIVDTRTDDTDRTRAKANAADALVSNPDLDAMVGLWSYNTPAILSAVREADKAGQIKIIGFDEEDATLEGVKSGDIVATVVQQPYEFGYKAIMLMNDYLNGETDFVPENEAIYVPTKVIDQSNVEEFSAQLQELRQAGEE